MGQPGRRHTLPCLRSPRQTHTSAPVHLCPGPPAPGRFTAGPAPPPLSPADPAPRPTEPCRPRLTPGPPTPRLGAVPEERLPASWKPRATPLGIQRAIVPQQEAGAGAACPAGCMDTRGHSLPWGPRGADASRSTRRGPRPHCGPRQREWTVQRPAGQCAPCTEPVVLQGTQGPRARARPWVPAEPQSLGGPLNLGRRAGPPAHGLLRWASVAGSRRLAAPGWLCPRVQGRQHPSTHPSMDLPRGDASQRGRQGLGRRSDLQDSLGAPGGPCVQAGPALQSRSQSCLGPALELEPARTPAHTLQASTLVLWACRQ